MLRNNSWIPWVTIVTVSILVGGCDLLDDAEDDASRYARPPSGDTQALVIDGLALTVPIEWSPAFGNDIRKAEFTLPGPAGEGHLVVYRLAGDRDAVALNIANWQGLIEPAAGTEPRAFELNHDGVHVVAVDMQGRFVGQVVPGMPAQPPIEHARMLAAAVMGRGSPFYFKLVGPAATVDMWTGAWHELLAVLAPA